MRSGVGRVFWALCLVAVPLATDAPAVSCRGSFLGCRSHAQRVRFCQAACTTTRTICRAAFIRRRLEQRCQTRALRVCLSEGGSCIHGCDAQHPCPAQQQCVSGRCIMAEPCKTACGSNCCGGDYPYCGTDGRCWMKPCTNLCGDGCCGGRYRTAGPTETAGRNRATACAATPAVAAPTRSATTASAARGTPHREEAAASRPISRRGTTV